MRRLLTAAASLGLVVGMSGVALGGSAPPPPTKMTMDAQIAPSGTTTVYGHLDAQFRVVPDGEIPGTLTFTGAPGSEVGHSAFIAKYVFFDYFRDAPGSPAYGNWTFLQGQQCDYMRSGADARCFDINYGLTDFWDPGRKDVISICTWPGGVRPTYGWEACEASDVEIGWYEVVQGSLSIH